MAVSPDHVPSIPDCSISGIKPVIEPINYEMVSGRKECSICGGVPTKTATYALQGVTVVEKYCNDCVKKTFARCG